MWLHRDLSRRNAWSCVSWIDASGLRVRRLVVLVAKTTPGLQRCELWSFGRAWLRRVVVLVVFVQGTLRALVDIHRRPAAGLSV